MAAGELYHPNQPSSIYHQTITPTPSLRYIKYLFYYNTRLSHTHLLLVVARVVL